jgi:VanZ family protein
MRKRLPLQAIIRNTGIVFTLLTCLAILYFSLIPAIEYPKISWIPFADKGDHMLAYTAFGFSLFLATLQIPGSGRLKKKENESRVLHLTSWSGRSVLISLLLGALLGSFVEIIQPLFGRSREWLDFFADIMGLVVGVAIALMLLKLVGSYFITRPWLYDPNWEAEIHDTI